MSRIWLILVAALALPAPAIGQLRDTRQLSEGWKFHKAGMPTTENVSIPHSWNACDGTTPEYWRGEGIYEYTLHLNKIPKEKRAFLRFEGVSQKAEVAVNGKYAGAHEGAFTAFCLEVTDLLRKGDNILTVRASNAPDKDIAPLAGDFTIFGGIYRPVSLIWLPSTCISPLDYASSGTYITQRSVSDREARLEITTMLDGKRLKPDGKISLRTSVFDPSGKLTMTVSTPYSAGPGNGYVTQEVTIENPQLWSHDTPGNRYRFFYEVLDGKTVVDTLSQTTGLRYFRIDPEAGFFLNGKQMKLNGVNRHQDRQGKGWAISNADHDQDMELIKEIGANAIRLAHYPHSAYFYNLCDANGMLVWAEIPFIERATESQAFSDNLKQQLTELIRQNYNHPSIFCWSLFNELSKGSPESLVDELNTLAHTEDPTRLTVAAANIEGRPENAIPDIMAFNTYPGWYWAEPEAMGPSIEWKNSSLGHKGVCISEYGAGASIYHHSQDITSAPKTDGHNHPEEWQATVHEGNYAEIRKRPYVWGSFVWNMFDFASASRNEGDARGINDKGLVTYDRRTKKDAFYFYKAQWSDEPVLYITSRRHEIRDNALTTVKAYTNCTDLTLTVNGRQMPLPKVNDNVAVWHDITLVPGQNIVEISGKRGDRTITDCCKWILRTDN